MSQDHDLAEATGIEIAIIGMAGRFPGADDVNAFWSNVRDGVESVTVFTDAQLRERGVPEARLADPAYVKAGVLFDGFDRFDAAFFDCTPREAELLDPQQRIFLECAWHALEHAGHDPRRCPGSVGVYAGDGPNLYLMRHLLPSFGLGAHSSIADLLALLSGNSPGSLCTRVAYKLNLRGPAVNVQTACSTSLTAVHTACQALLSHDCDMALAGGVWMNLLQEGGYQHQEGAILSPDGHCRAFDEKAAGTVIGSGAGLVVLKRLDEALRDGDTVHAVIKGSAMNNDGASKVGFTAPSVQGQADVIRAAQRVSGVPPDSVTYVEAHGTGTMLGDPIEVAALTKAFRSGTSQQGFCALGSVKTNVGHLDAAAGVTGLIKAVMALTHRTLPGSLHYTRPNPQIDFAASPFYVNATTRPWPATSVPRRAGVSSFGIGGTNVHVVLEEAPAPVARPVPAARGWHVLPVSAKSAPALAQARLRLAAHLRANPGLDVADVAHTLQRGRSTFAFRDAVVARDVTEGADALERDGSAPRGAVGATAPEVVFLFPGSGTQHAQMGAALYRDEPVFRAEVDRCCEALRRDGGLDLRALMFPAAGAEAAADEQLARVENAQPALFIVSYAMAVWWMSRGVRPAWMIGHSLGEYVAACVAGVFSVDDALRIVAARGRLMQSLPTGAMLAVPLSPADVEPFTGPGCEVGAINGPALCVLSGTVQAIDRAEAALGRCGHATRRLHVGVASHSEMTEPIVAALEAVIAAVPRHAPALAYVSNVTGLPITAAEATDPAYWGRHLRRAVRFEAGLAETLRTPGRVVLEVGPGETLAGLARQHPLGAGARGIWASQSHPQQRARNELQLAQTVAGLWCAGLGVGWTGPAGRRVPLPGYPFEHKSFWVAADATGGAPPPPASAEAAEHVHVPVWKRTEPAAHRAGGTPAGCTLLFAGESDLTDTVLRQLTAQQRPVVRVDIGPAFKVIAADHVTVRSGERGDIEAMLRETESRFGRVVSICHLGNVDAGLPPEFQGDAVLERGYFHVVALVQALHRTADGERGPVQLTLVTNHAEDVTGIEPLSPRKGMLAALCQVVGQEHAEFDCCSIDVAYPAGGADDVARTARQIIAEVQSDRSDALVAYRGPHRWTRHFETVPLRGTEATQRLRRGGTYLVTGGLGGVGLALASHLAKAWQARLVLVGRTALPARSHWEALVGEHSTDAKVRGVLQQLLALEAGGTQLMAVAGDVTDPSQMRDVLGAVHQRFGPLNGVVHAAGHAHTAMLSAQTRQAAEAMFAAKVQGTDTLLHTLRDEPLDFLVLCSSVATVAGGLGMGHYAAANAYLDAIAARRQRAGGFPVISVGWDAWRDIGMAARRALPAGIGIDGPTGAQAFERIVNGPLRPQVFVSPMDMASRRAGVGDGLLSQLEAVLPQRADPGSVHPRPALQQPYVAAEGELEHDIAALWTQRLGVAPVGVHDNLFELGGDSLLAIQLLAHLRTTYGVSLRPADFLHAPTVSHLAELIESALIDEIEREQPLSAPTTV